MNFGLTDGSATRRDSLARWQSEVGEVGSIRGGSTAKTMRGGGEKGREYGREMDPWGVSLPLTRPEANWPESRVAFPSSGSGIMADLHVSRQANSRPAGWSSEHEELL